ncbi:hypothetical protein KIN20_014068 [Parelaphostrongylus tenuis]|uniref:Uncharacterized protein n=1 Tax=Parelaphostrongylus tenuis TaxID=148309 RepID=A0AAD5QRK4_PARTN|nr:hypothetical protein KIN20_014068 [Parelaphostrongylus tenuis]
MEGCVTAEAVRESDVCDVKSALQSFTVPFDDEDFLVISEKISSLQKDLHSAGSYVFSDRMVTRAIERLDDRIDSWAREQMAILEQERKGSQFQRKKVEVDDDWVDSRKGGGKKKGGRGTGGKPNKSAGPTREETAVAVNVPSETLTEWLTNAKLQQKTQSLYSSICLFESSISSFPDALRGDLSQFTLRTVGTEFANLVLSYASGTENTSLLKEKKRDELITSLPKELRDGIGAVFSSLRGTDLDAFHSAVFDLSSPMALSFVLKQPDAKARAEVLDKYVAELREQVLSQSEPAATLLSCVLFLLAKHEKPVTASGRFVAQLVSQLEGVVDESTFDLLVSCQRLVVQCLKYKDDEVAKDMLMSDIEKLKQKITA